MSPKGKVQTLLYDVMVRNKWSPHGARLTYCVISIEFGYHELSATTNRIFPQKIKVIPPATSNFYRPQTKLRKGNVLHLSVILFTGGRCTTASWQTPPKADTPFPPRRPLQRTVRILLEYILVINLNVHCERDPVYSSAYVVY